MSFKRNTFDDDNNGGSDNDQPFQKRQRFEGDGGRGGRGGRGRGRGDNFRGGRGGGGFRGRGGGGFNRFGNDNDDSGFVDRRGRGGFRGGGDRFNRDNRGGGGFRGRGGGRGFGGNRFDDRGRGRGRGGGRGRGFGDRRGGFGGNRPFNDSIIKVNQDAPDFQNIPNENSENVSLRQFRGQYVVLFIYFKDKTYSCSTEQKAFRDLKSQFDKYNAVILGVSRDDAESHKDAISDAELNFSLLADTDSKILQSYGALDDNNRVNRSTFIISPEGKIAAVWGRVFGFDKHPQEVLDKLREIASEGTNNTSKKASHNNDNDDQDDDNDGDDNDNDDNNNGNDDDDDDDDE